MSRLFIRLAAAFVAFVVAGSLALLFWTGAEERRQSRELFAAMAKANAEFVRTGAPQTERTELSLSEVLGVDVYFFSGGERFNRALPQEHLRAAVMAWQNEGTVVLAGELESVAVSVTPGHSLVLVRKQPELRAFSSARTYGVLGAFWVISLALAAVLARGIVVPLRRLAARLPHIAEDGREVLPEAARADEIGQLARAYQETREQLAKERAAREQAERMATLGRMATGLAHEINNPVAAIRLHAQLLEGDAPDESLAMILSENAKIESLVNQWMFLARPQPPAVTPCDLAGLVADCVRTVAPAAAHSGVRIFQEVGGGCVVNGDRRRLGQAVVNILMNAIHAMSQGGELTVRGRLIEQGSVQLDFSDTGPGFSSEALAKATELFFSEKEGGMGIGLNVTAEIAKAHKGELRIANSGKGAVVSLILLKHELNL